jgi:hypothetical protein
MANKPYAFFYGGYMNPEVLKASGTTPEACEVGYIEGHGLTVGPIANLVETEGARAYGLLARLSHSDLNVLYGGAPAALKGAVYLPEAVLVHTADGRAIPALTYISPALSGEAPEPEYIEKLLDAAEEIGLPSYYLTRIKNFAP